MVGRKVHHSLFLINRTPAVMRVRKTRSACIHEASSGYQNRTDMLVKIREVFDTVEYVVWRLFLFVVGLVGAYALIAHAIKSLF
jgi:hypothetical protein